MLEEDDPIDHNYKFQQSSANRISGWEESLITYPKHKIYN